MVLNILGKVLLLAWTPGAGVPAPAHDGPPVCLEIELGSEQIELELTGERSVLHPWLDLPVELEPGADEGRERLRSAILRGFETNYELKLEQQRVELEVAEVGPGPDIAFGGLPSTRILLTAAVERVPRRVDLGWRASFGEEWNGEPMPVQFGCYGRLEWHTVDETDPGCTWIARKQERRRAGFPELPPVEDSPPPDPRRLPLLSIGLGAAALLPLLLRRGALGLRLGVLLLGLGAAFSLRDVGAVELAAEAEAPALPDADQALATFEALHRNIYAALSAESEDEIYARLARSFDGSILERQYLDLLYAMQLRLHGGAVCTVESLEVLERAVDFERPPPEDVEVEDDTLAYWVEWRWRVLGQVVHWAHRHQRMNQYHARYWLRHDGRAWRIAAVEELDWVRIDDDEEDWGSWLEEGSE